MPVAVGKNKKSDGVNEPLELHKKFCEKNLTRVIFPLAPAAIMLGTSQFFTGCTNLQYSVILKSIWETDSIITFLPV